VQGVGFVAGSGEGEMLRGCVTGDVQAVTDFFRLEGVGGRDENRWEVEEVLNGAVGRGHSWNISQHG
jgi:hypothetical protein